ncbi:phage tail fiber protein [Arsenophonus sp. PmNCSU2021_1]|uniref:phage tail fiber protein n=1 Tax=Arsenophonus sp. PmNCSU2021_1 TaxID=3118989 RepID=UPI002FF0C81D
MIGDNNNSDAARALVAANTYIIYFLQNMNTWMTENGVVEITLPSGKTVKLASIKALQELVESKADASSIEEIKTALESKADTKTVEDISETVTGKFDKESVVQEIGSATDKVMSQKASTDILAKKDSNEQLRAGKISASHSTGDSVIWLGDPKEGYDLVYVRSSKRGFIRNNRLSVATYFPDKDGTFALLSDIPKMIADANGFFKRASPIVKIHPDGSFETNEESEGARVQRTGIGSYFISGVMGYNADGAWGVNGGISIPKDINGLELIYVRDKILSNGDIEIQTFHRQHTHLPRDFQNWRIKEIIDGKPVYYADGEQVDIPPSTWLDVRVQMPVDSIWGQQQRLKAK